MLDFVLTNYKRMDTERLEWTKNSLFDRYYIMTQHKYDERYRKDISANYLMACEILYDRTFNN